MRDDEEVEEEEEENRGNCAKERGIESKDRSRIVGLIPMV